MSDKKPMNLSGLTEAGKSVARAPEKSEIRFEHLGVKVGQHVPEKSGETPVDFSSIGGRRVLDNSNHPANAATDAPKESMEADEGDTD
jgi:hypothetical protein